MPLELCIFAMSRPAYSNLRTAPRVAWIGLESLAAPDPKPQDGICLSSPLQLRASARACCSASLSWRWETRHPGWTECILALALLIEVQREPARLLVTFLGRPSGALHPAQGTLPRSRRRGRKSTKIAKQYSLDGSTHHSASRAAACFCSASNLACFSAAWS